MRIVNFREEMGKIGRNSLYKFFFWILVAAFGTIGPIAISRAEEALYDAHGRRDPFAPLVTMQNREAAGLSGVESVDDLKIEGVVMDPGGSVVVVNGLVMKEGDEIGSIKLVEVKSNGARFVVNGTETFVTLYNEDLKGK